MINCLYKLLLVILLMLFWPDALLAQTKRALVIGLGQQEDKKWEKINGDKDIDYVLEILKDAGYYRTDITTLLNTQATKLKIVEAFKQLAITCDAGDIVYVHFSGHGQQMRDEHNDETDGLDECWIPYDAYRKPCEKDYGEKHLTDDEINVYLNAIRNKIGDMGKMLVVIDACHSGDATRGGEDVVRGVKDIFLAVKSYLTNSSQDAKDIVNPNAKLRAERWISISACESNQLNIEMRNPTVGKLTYALYKKIKEKPIEDNNEFFRHLRMFVNSNTSSRPQRPVLSGEIHRYSITDILR